MDFNERFKTLLEEYGKPARQFVKDFNEADPKDITLTTSAVTEMKNNGRTPRLDTAIKIAALFGVSTDYLLGVSQTRRSGMTKEEYSAAYMDGANDAWELARRNQENLKSEFLTVMGAKLLADKICEMHDFDDEEG